MNYVYWCAKACPLSPSVKALVDLGDTGEHFSHSVSLVFFQNVLIIDIDKKQFVRCQGDENTLLPKKIEKALKTSLNMCKIDDGKAKFITFIHHN